MGDSKERALATFSRMKEAYGVATNVEFCEFTGVPQPTVSNWLSRGSVPLRYVYECAEKTGTDLDWLLRGEVANASFSGVPVSPYAKSQTTYNEFLAEGGKSVLQRILLSYGFTTQKQLGDLLGISSGTMSTWVRRDFFPGDVVVACALDTGVNLEWLATGKGEIHGADKIEKGRQIEHLELFAGKIQAKGWIVIDPILIPEKASTPAYISRGKQAWVVDMDQMEISSGTLLLNVDNDIDVYTVSRLPGNQIKACNVNEGIEFTCNVSDVKSEGRVIITLTTVA